MDFKSILSKLDSMEAPPQGIAAPQLPKTVQLDESAQLRVLAGQSTILAEAKKKSEEEVEEAADMKAGEKKTSSTGGTIEKTKTGLKHTAGKHYGGDKAPKDEEDDKKSKKVKESAKPDFLDVDGDGDKKEPMKKAAAEKGGDKKGMSDKQAKYFGKKDEAVEEAADMKAGEKKTSSTGGTIEKTKTGLKHTSGKNYSGKTAEKENKKAVAESADLTFAKALKIIKESNGTAQIDPLDGDLWKWARRVAESKFTESVKIDVYAATTYERMGGSWSIVQITE